jgi:malonyl-CoA/methylmalonyl-CoA synthetase
MTALKKHMLPADPVLERLLIEAQRATDPEIIVDFGRQCKKSYSHLLGDILKTRDQFCVQEEQPGLNQNKSYQDVTYVSILTNNGYEYMVAFFAIRAMGYTPMALGRFNP